MQRGDLLSTPSDREPHTIIVRFPGSHPSECQWLLKRDESEPAWQEEERSPVETCLLAHMDSSHNNYWIFTKCMGRFLVSRLGWGFSQWCETSEQIVTVISRYYQNLYPLLPQKGW